ncbi:MAG: MogA/MoaB family molybdenum cofactor biosynthesis protein [Lachnospiraceae bacterium]
MKVAIITASTAVYREKEENQSGEVIRKMVEEEDMEVVFMKALPNDRKVLSTVFQRMADNHLADLILTTGGAGCAPEDCTPEATMDVVDRPVVGIPEGMRAHMLSMTKRTMLNRSAAGIRGDVMIVNLPGKAGAVKVCLEYILPEVIHAVKVIKGEA